MKVLEMFLALLCSSTRFIGRRYSLYSSYVCYRPLRHRPPSRSGRWQKGSSTIVVMANIFLLIFGPTNELAVHELDTKQIRQITKTALTVHIYHEINRRVVDMFHLVFVDKSRILNHVNAGTYLQVIIGGVNRPMEIRLQRRLKHRRLLKRFFSFHCHF